MVLNRKCSEEASTQLFWQRIPQNDSLLRVQFSQNLDHILSKFPNSAIIIMGDFNRFNTANLCSSFKVKNLLLYERVEITFLIRSTLPYPNVT